MELFFGWLSAWWLGAQEPEVSVPEAMEMVQDPTAQLSSFMAKNDLILEPGIRGEASAWSFKSFLEKDFVGDAFTVGNLLTDWGTHKSYYATYLSDGLKISATWHVPNGEGPFLVLILNHGYFPPDEYTNGYGFGREQKYFARAGYAVLHIDYRGYGYSDKAGDDAPGARIWGNQGYAADAINAALALKGAELPYLDTSRIGLFGHSLGGGVVLDAALARPDLFTAGVMWGPVSSNFEDNFNKWRRDEMTAEQETFFVEQFGPLDDSDSFKGLSAYPYLDRLAIPLQIQHGTADESCPVAWSHQTVARLEALDKSVQYITYDDVPHVFWNEDWNLAALDALDFFNVWLKPDLEA